MSMMQELCKSCFNLCKKHNFDNTVLQGCVKYEKKTLKEIKKVNITYDCAVLFSGGLDSTASLLCAIRKGHKKILCISINYGHKPFIREWEAGENIIKMVRHVYDVLIHRIKIDMPNVYKQVISFAGMPKPFIFTGRKMDIKNDGALPHRNLMLTTEALTVCEILEIKELYVGYGYCDEMGVDMAYDATGEYLRRVKYFFNSGDDTTHYYRGEGEDNIQIISPMWLESKLQFIKSIMSGPTQTSILNATWSCQGAWKKPCGTCRSCQLRKRLAEELRKEGYDAQYNCKA